MNPFLIAALVVAVVAEFIAHGKDLTAWAVIIALVGLLGLIHL